MPLGWRAGAAGPGWGIAARTSKSVGMAGKRGSHRVAVEFICRISEVMAASMAACASPAIRFLRSSATTWRGLAPRRRTPLTELLSE